MIESFLAVYTVLFIIVTCLCLFVWGSNADEYGAYSQEARNIVKAWLAAVTFPVTFPFTLYLLVKYAFNEGE